MPSASASALCAGASPIRGLTGIRVNSVAPWVTLTPLLAAALRTNPLSLDKASASTPLRRPAEPHEIAAAIVFLALPAASYITGHCIHADGGLMASGFAVRPNTRATDLHLLWLICCNH